MTSGNASSRSGASDLPYELDDEAARPHAVSYGRDILVVDDNEANRIAIEAALGQLGRKVVMAASGIEALGRLLEQDFALIILDVAMPGMDGFETAKMVRSRDRNRSTPIIFVTGMSWQDDEVLRGYELGAFDFLMKPIRAEVLRAKASVFVQLQERTIELQEKAEELRLEQARAHEREMAATRKKFETDILERQMQQMADVDRRKDEFLAILSHELRNPLQPLQTAVEVLEHDPDAPVPPRIRSIIHRQVHHITRLVDDLLDIARLNAGRLELRREPVKLCTVVEEATEAFKKLAGAKTQTLIVTCSDKHAVVNGDATRLVQVVSNLLSNAVKYTPANGTITVDSGADTDEGYIRVTDTGKGIPAHLVGRVFDMFVEERTEPSGKGGLGLGLGLVKRLVEMHNGTVQAKSPGADRGATFEVRIALATAAAVEAPKAAPVATSDKPLRAVVCDDAADLRDLVADLLRLRGHEVTVVADGKSAVETITRERPDVALIDIGLPEMDGYEVARQLRATLGAASPRLIAMTGYGTASDRAAAFAAGFDAHIVKPASAETILSSLRGHGEES